MLVLVHINPLERQWLVARVQKFLELLSLYGISGVKVLPLVSFGLSRGVEPGPGHVVAPFVTQILTALGT